MVGEPGNPDEAFERSLIVQAKAGDRDAFSRLIQRYIQRVYRTSYAIMRNDADAEDLTQETFVRAYQGITRFDESRPIFPWLYRIARNLCLNRIERVKKRETVMPEFDYLSDRAPGPEETAMAAEQRCAVRRAIENLPEQHRQIIELSHFQECSYREIADILDIPIGTVMSRLYNARQKLKALLEDEDGQ